MDETCRLLVCARGRLYGHIVDRWHASRAANLEKTTFRISLEHQWNSSPSYFFFSFIPSSPLSFSSLFCSCQVKGAGRSSHCSSLGLQIKRTRSVKFRKQGPRDREFALSFPHSHNDRWTHSRAPEVPNVTTLPVKEFDVMFVYYFYYVFIFIALLLYIYLYIYLCIHFHYIFIFIRFLLYIYLYIHFYYIFVYVFIFIIYLFLLYDYFSFVIFLARLFSSFSICFQISDFFLFYSLFFYSFE